MSLRHVVAIALSVLLGGIAATALDASAAGPGATVFKECAFVEAGWHPEYAPSAVNRKYHRITAVPEGWTPVNGDMGGVAAILVCR